MIIYVCILLLQSRHFKYSNSGNRRVIKFTKLNFSFSQEKYIYLILFPSNYLESIIMQRSILGNQKTRKQVDKSFKEEGKGDRRSYNRDWKFELEIVFARFLRVEMPTRFAVSVQGYIYIRSWYWPRCSTENDSFPSLLLGS